MEWNLIHTVEDPKECDIRLLGKCRKEETVHKPSKTIELHRFESKDLPLIAKVTKGRKGKVTLIEWFKGVAGKE